MPFKVAALFAALIAASWLYLAYQAWQMQTLPMTQLWMPPSALADWRLADYIWLSAMWAVMTAAMMLPSAWPMLQTFAVYCRRGGTSAPAGTLLFAAGYLTVWLLFSVLPTLLQSLLHSRAWLSPMMENRQPWLAAALLMLAGSYQFAAFKNACLRLCRSTLGFLLRHWQPGRRGAFNMGFKHGLYCLGCCWAQMLLMFAFGVMSLSAMVWVSLMVLVEKWAPVPAETLSRTLGCLLLLWGVYLGLTA
ncbi:MULTISPECIES: DUF2182 domain-containing protein [Methylomonas]|uniref:DUF2182 domain-containing protein n=1 Tax=Methylomonas TaxID=416 RepID=UPI001232BBF5|nr:DUF2182 domain-containing protein [Methylomonas rhizoryzae]